jgi:tRNA threonylcarbamoyladenosine dehydratase
VSLPLPIPADTDQARRFGGLERLYGVTGAANIRAAHVAVIGIGRITLIDFDQVAESNINRQVHAETSTVGMAKVDAMHDRIAQINPQCQVTCIEEFATPDNWSTLATQGGFSAVIDACDQVKTKVALAVWARAQSTGQTKAKTAPLFITVGAAGGKRRADKVEIADLSETTHDPLLAQVRYRLRREHAAPRDKRMGITCVFSRESVAPPDPSCAIEGDGSLNCHGYGSVVAVTASFGMCAAGWVLDELAKYFAIKHRSLQIGDNPAVFTL